MPVLTEFVVSEQLFGVAATLASSLEAGKMREDQRIDLSLTTSQEFRILLTRLR